MNTALSEMFAKSTYSISPPNYVYAKVATLPSPTKHFMVTQDADEISVVTAEENLQELDLLEKNEHSWKLVSLNLETPFMAGTLAAINSACAETGLNNLIVSTYSKDYILVRDDQLSEIKKVLHKLGFKEKTS